MKVIDTDIFIDFFRGFPQALPYLKEHADEISFSAITEGELLSGSICNNNKEREKVFHVLSQFEKIPVDNPLIQIAADIRRTYRLELPDAIVAASALITNATLITRNMRDFQKIHGLQLQKPY
ncbi:MAG: type II toxin-antitoxin system VapC family toxin [Nanoarchaeota archaeon]